MKIKYLLIIFIVIFALIASLFSLQRLYTQETYENDFLDDYNVLLITSETLRADRLGFYGYDRNTTPNIDKLAEDSIVFKDAVSPTGTTGYSMSQVFSSLYFETDNIGEHLTDRGEDEIGQVNFDGDSSLVKEFKNRGFYTFGIVPQPPLVGQFGFDSYFEYYVDEPLPHGTHDLEYVDDKLEHIDLDEDTIVPVFELNDYFERMVAENVTESAMEFIVNNEDSFFGWLHYIDPHSPFMPPEREYFEMFESDIDEVRDIGEHKVFGSMYNITNYEKQRLKDLYDGEIRYLDKYIGELIDFLKEIGEYNETIIIFTADHGECLGKHNLIGHNNLFNCSVKIPLIIRVPGMEHEVIEKPVSGIDVFPTIFDILDMNVDRFMRGQSMLKDEDERRDFRYLEYSKDHYRLIGEDYDLHVEYGEIVYEENFDQADEKLEEIRNISYDHFNGSLDSLDEVDSERRDEIEESLRDLGYID